MKVRTVYPSDPIDLDERPGAAPPSAQDQQNDDDQSKTAEYRVLAGFSLSLVSDGVDAFPQFSKLLANLVSGDCACVFCTGFSHCCFPEVFWVWSLLAPSTLSLRQARR